MEQQAYNLALTARQIIKERGLTVQMLHDLLAPNFTEDWDVSKTTLRDLMDDDNWEHRNFKLKTIQPIVAILVGPDDPTISSAMDAEFDPTKAREYYLKWQAALEMTVVLENEKKELSMLHDKNIDRLLSVQHEGCAAQAKVIDILEKHTTFMEERLTNEMESKRSLYNDHKRLYDLMESFHDVMEELRKDVADLKK